MRNRYVYEQWLYELKYTKLRPSLNIILTNNTAERHYLVFPTGQPCFFPVETFTLMELAIKRCGTSELLIGYKSPQGSQQLYALSLIPPLWISHFSSTQDRLSAIVDPQ